MGTNFSAQPTLDKMASTEDYDKPLKSRNSTSEPNSNDSVEPARLSNLQKITQRKEQIKNLPREKMVEKIAIYSQCKVGKFD